MNKVLVYKETKPIKTYLVGEPDFNPFISEYLGSLLFYPYPLKDKVSDEVKIIDYSLFCLENDYFKVSFLPDFGGKLYSAFDKRYQKDIFYCNPVIKPRLVGCTGAWTSGGIEFNFPNRGHRPTAADYTDTITKEYQDGSASVIINDIDMISWQRFSVEIKLSPEKAYIEQIVRMYNPNDYTDSYYFWTTSAELEKEGLEFRYPFLWHIEEESRKKYLWPFPENSPFAGEGVDLRYTDTMKPFTLPFGCEVLNDYMGLYYPDEDGGVVHVADYREVPGKKVWAWGNASAGKLWCQRLTDNDDRYVELQTGAVETQNEFNLIDPHNQLLYKEYWLYSGNNGPLCAASKDIIASYQIKDSIIKFKLIGTDSFAGVMLAIVIDNKEVYSTALDISPVNSNQVETPFHLDWMDHDIEFIVKRGEDVLIRETILTNQQALEMIDREEYISEDESRESRFAQALFFEKRRFYNNALHLYTQIIDDNPEYIQAYIRKSNCYLKKHDFKRALATLAEVIKENPEDRELIYYYAVALWHNGQLKKALKYFFKVPNSSKYFATASYFIALYYVIEKKYDKALPKLEYAMQQQPFHYKGFLLYAYALLKADKKAQAKSFLEDFLQDHPMDYIAMYLLDHINQKSSYQTLILGQKQNVYQLLGFFDQIKDWPCCLDIIVSYLARSNPFSLLSAYRYYYLELIEGGKREQLVQAVDQLNLDCLFPNHPIDIKILGGILDQSQNAKYLYGLLQYRAENYQEVKQLWGELAEQDFHYSVLYRNLAYYYQKYENDYARSMELAEKGFSREPINNDFFYLLYQSYQILNRQDKLLSLLQLIEELDTKSEPCIRVWIDLLNNFNQHQKAARLLENSVFNLYEHDPENLIPYSKIYKETYLGLTREGLREKDYPKAREAIEKCLTMEKRYEEKFAEIYFYAGLINEKTGEFSQALQYYQKIFAENISRDDQYNYPYYVKAAHRMVKLNWVGIK